MSDMKQQNRLYLIIYVAALLMLSGQLITGCSSTSALKEDEQLFTGLVPIEYKNYELMLILPSPRWSMPWLRLRTVLCSEAAITALRSLCACGYGMLSLSRMEHWLSG